jgi:hypothetical protein
MGAQWRHTLGEFELFVQGVYEHQTWFGAGTYFDQPSQRTQFSQSVRSHDHDAALMGFAFAVGIEH